MMNRRIFDIDIDVASVNRSDYGTRAMIYNEDAETINPHPAGVYLEEVPVDKLTGNCAFDYKYGNEKGYMKVDLLTNNSYFYFKSKNELLELMEEEPDWTMLDKKYIVYKLPHIANHFDLISKIKPRSFMELSDALALIRPGKKEHIDDYLKNKEKVRKYLYKRPKNGGHYFKKAHAISLTMLIVAVMNKIKRGMIQF